MTDALGPSATLIANIEAILSAEPELGIRSIFKDMAPMVLPDDMPAVAITPRRVRERRMAGGQDNGDKAWIVDLEMYVYQVGTFDEQDQAGIAFQALLESIMARIRTTGFANLGVNEWAGEMLADRFPPLADAETFSLIGVVTLVGLTMYFDG